MVLNEEQKFRRGDEHDVGDDDRDKGRCDAVISAQVVGTHAIHLPDTRRFSKSSHEADVADCEGRQRTDDAEPEVDPGVNCRRQMVLRQISEVLDVDLASLVAGQSLDVVLEEARYVEDDAAQTDADDRHFGSGHTDQTKHPERTTDGQVATRSHGDGEPSARQDEGVDDCTAVRSVDELEVLGRIGDPLLPKKTVWKETDAEQQIKGGQSAQAEMDTPLSSVTNHLQRNSHFSYKQITVKI